MPINLKLPRRKNLRDCPHNHSTRCNHPEAACQACSIQKKSELNWFFHKLTVSKKELYLEQDDFFIGLEPQSDQTVISIDF